MSSVLGRDFRPRRPPSGGGFAGRETGGGRSVTEAGRQGRQSRPALIPVPNILEGNQPKTNKFLIPCSFSMCNVRACYIFIAAVAP